MYQVITRCDICSKVLPITPVETPFGTVNIVETGKTMVVDTRGLFRHLCKECALRIDNELLKFKLDILENKN